MNQQLLAMMFWKNNGKAPKLDRLRIFAIVFILGISIYIFYLVFKQLSLL